jgi:hypothetical protein
MNKLFEKILREGEEDFEEVDRIINSYKNKNIPKEQCIRKLISAWGKAGYSVSPDNAEEFLNIIMKD